MVSMAIGGAGGALDMAAGIGIGIAGAMGAHIPAMLRCMALPPVGGVVPFDFNPKEIKVDRTGVSRNPSAMQTGARPATLNVPPAKITLNEVWFEGRFTKARCDTLLNWMAPALDNAMNQVVGAAVGMIAGALGAGAPNIETAPPDLTFQWGPPLLGFMYTVQLSSLNVTYTRFDPTGIPLRAKVTMALTELPSPLGNLPTNPTSGGQPGRRTHVLRDGESLASLAQFYFGHPGAWRRIAEVNGIEDARRVRPCRTIFLPNPQELASGA
jgi:Contractile injection system tube protein